MTDKVLYDICEQYLAVHAPEEMDLLILNSNNIHALKNNQGNKYTDSFASGIEIDIVLPALIFILGLISSLIIKDGYIVTKDKIKEYLDKNPDKIKINESDDKEKINIIVVNIINIIKKD